MVGVTINYFLLDYLSYLFPHRILLDGNHFESEKTHYSKKFIIKTFLNKEHFPLFPTRATDSKKK